ncbi:MAG: hypothetical protein U1E78_12200 [Gammaproteobacteria bacterium]
MRTVLAIELIFFVLLQAKICYAEELNKSLFVLPESRHNEVTGSRGHEFTIENTNPSLPRESDLMGFDSPDIAGSRDLDGGIMLTPDRIAKDINRQAQVSKPGYRIPYLTGK